MIFGRTSADLLAIVELLLGKLEKADYSKSRVEDYFTLLFMKNPRKSERISRSDLPFLTFSYLFLPFSNVAEAGFEPTTQRL